MAKILNNEIFGRNIQNIRIARGLTQEQTVMQLQLLGSPLSRSTYSLIELGRGNIFVSDLVALKEVFQTEYDAFFEGIPFTR